MGGGYNNDNPLEPTLSSLSQSINLHGRGSYPHVCGEPLSPASRLFGLLAASNFISTLRRRGFTRRQMAEFLERLAGILRTQDKE